MEKTESWYECELAHHQHGLYADFFSSCRIRSDVQSVITEQRYESKILSGFTSIGSGFTIRLYSVQNAIFCIAAERSRTSLTRALVVDENTIKCAPHIREKGQQVLASDMEVEVNTGFQSGAV